MANLQFKMGEYAGLKNVAKETGTIYITTDEKAMYVDIGTGEHDRIRIG
jgi:hypothetical protein